MGFKFQCKKCEKQATIHINTGIEYPKKKKRLREEQGFYCNDHNPWKIEKGKKR